MMNSTQTIATAPTACICDCHRDFHHCEQCCDTPDNLCDDCCYYLELRLSRKAAMR